MGTEEKRKLPAPLLTALILAVTCAALTAFIVVTWTGYQKENAPIIEKNAQLEAELRLRQEENKAAQEQLEQLTAREQTLRSRSGELEAALADYAIFIDRDGPSREEYIQEQMVNLLEQRQDLINGVRSEMTLNLNSFFSAFGAAEYVPPEPINVGREFLKDAVSALAGEMDPPVTDVLGDVASEVIDNGTENILDTAESAALSAIGGKLFDSALEAAGVDGVASAVGSANGALSKLKDIFDSTPDAALALTLQDALGYAGQVTEVLNDPAADAEALRRAVDAYDQFRAYRRAAMDLRDEVGLTGMSELSHYGELARVEAIDQALGIYAILLGEEAAS